jgi:hypothetical protein
MNNRRARATRSVAEFILKQAGGIGDSKYVRDYRGVISFVGVKGLARTIRRHGPTLGVRYFKNRLKHAAPWMLTRFKRKVTVPEEQPTVSVVSGPDMSSTTLTVTTGLEAAPEQTSKKWYQSAKGWADKACRWLRKTK